MNRDCCRMWDVDRDENYVLGLKMNDVVDNTEMITCIAFCQAKGRESFSVRIGAIVALVSFCCTVPSLLCESCRHDVM